jgi:predicted alpha/beta superfamily hydrolase
MHCILYMLTALWLITAPTQAKTVTTNEITIGTKVTIKSKVLDESREVMIYLPNNYNKNNKYQVIYLLDGEYYFISTAGIINSLMSTRQIPDAILVALKTTIRVRDFLPPIVGDPKSRQQKWIQKKFPKFGHTKNFQTFLQTELFPYVEKNYSTLPSRTIIGHSNAGVFGLHTLLNTPELFTNYLIISPAGWWGESEIDEQFLRFSTSNPDFSGNLFLTIGNEGQSFYSNVLRIAANLEKKSPKSLSWYFKHYENENHQTTVYPSIYNGLVKLFSDFQFDDTDNIGKYGNVSDIQNYYQSLSEKYKFEINIPTQVLSNLADQQFLNGRNEEALTTLKYFVIEHPNFTFSHSSLGDGYMRIKQFDLAKKHFEKALAIAFKQEIKDPTVIDFLKDMIATADSKI